MHYIFFFFLLLLPHVACAFTIVQKPILFNQTRIELTREYQRHHYGIKSARIEIDPKIIVLHWTETKTLNKAFQEFYSPFLSSTRTRVARPAKCFRSLSR